MANQSGQRLPPRFRPGQSLCAEDLNRIVAMLASRIVGGKGVQVRTFGSQVILEKSDPPPSGKAGVAGTSVKIGFIASGSGSGPYNVNVCDNGPDQSPTDSVNAYPLVIAAGQSFPVNTGVVLVWVSGADDGAGRWYFQGPVWLSD